MKNTCRILLKMFALVLISMILAGTLIAQDNLIMKAMEDELGRSVSGLQDKGEAPLYYLGYTITDLRELTLSSMFGVQKNRNSSHRRYLDVDVRIGDHKMDSTHELRDDYSSMFLGYRSAESIPVEDDYDAIRNVIWRETDKEYKKARQKYTKLKTNMAIKVKEEDPSDDFSKETPYVSIEKIPEFDMNENYWQEKIDKYSSLFKQSPVLLTGHVNLIVNRVEKIMLTSEGSRLQTGYFHVWLRCEANTRAEDGMHLKLYRNFFAVSLEKLPSDKEVADAIKNLISELEQLREAPYVEPYTGPAILLNQASAVFFHEIFGHRIEGHRQKSVREGQTFTKRLGEAILPEFINIYDDPTMKEFNEFILSGHYNYDDEGIKAARVDVVKKGVLKNFLMSRNPVKGFAISNGHGRREKGNSIVSRQGNLVIESDKTVSFKDLKKMLIKECKKQKKPYGLIFKDISGGFTTTRRYSPQSFKVIPLVVYKVFPDGKPDQIVRGVDIVGTPLTSFSKIIATGDDYDVFNGFCGAESGTIPVSCVSPSIFVSEIEVEKKIRSQDKPPILPSPLLGKSK